MILELFVVLMLLALILILLGYFTDDSWYAYVGLLFFFFLGIFLFSNQVQFKVGEVANTSYVYSVNSTVPSNTFTTTSFTYDSFTGSYARWFGLFLAFSSGAGMAATLIQYRKRKEEEY